MYTVGARTATVDAFTPAPALVQGVDGQYVPANQQYVPANQLVTTGVARPMTVAQPVRVRTAATPRRVYRPVETVREAPVQDRVYREETQPQRSWKKTALIIGGSTAAGAGTGAIVGGKKGALIGAAIGGGASSIYEATKR
jgi:hypothetical protein